MESQRTYVLPLILVCCLMACAGATGLSAATLVAQYDFSNAANLGQDSSGNGNSLTNYGVVQGTGPDGLASGIFGYGSILSGSLSGFNVANGFSYAAWVNLSGIGGAWDGIISQDGGICCYNRLMVNPSGQTLVNVAEHNDQVVNTAIGLNTWVFLVLTAQNSGGHAVAQVYTNGSAVGGPLQFLQLSNVSLNTYIGSGEGGGAWYLYGQLADVQIYSGALTAGQVAALYRTGSIVPEPGSILLLAAGLAAVVCSRTRRRR